jgi:hypothetical protein
MSRRTVEIAAVLSLAAVLVIVAYLSQRRDNGAFFENTAPVGEREAS